MVGPGESPHSYEPKARQMTALSQSAVYFPIGVEFEDAWMDRILSANPDMRMVDLTEHITEIPAAASRTGSEADHHDEMDPHIWTSPELAKTIAQNAYTALADLDPAHAEDYRIQSQCTAG